MNPVGYHTSLLRPAHEPGIPISRHAPRDGRIPSSRLRAGPLPTFGSIWDQLLVFLLLANSGNPGLQTLMGGPENTLVVSLAGLLLILALRRGLHVNPLGAVPFLVFGAILVAQGLSFEFFPRITVLGFMVKLAIAGSVCVLVPRFGLTFVRVMAVLCGLSLLFWILGFVRPWSALVSGHGLVTRSADMDYPRISILVHTYFRDVGGFGSRNVGMFWEPGAWAGYLNLALVLMACQRRVVPPRMYRRYLALFSAGVLSTLSTGGYLGLAAAYGLGELAGTQKGVLRPSLGERRWNWLPAGGAIVLVMALLVMWNRVDFLGPKIRRQYEQTALQGGRWHLTRFGTMVLDWEYIRRRPLTGWGLHDRTRWALHGGVYHDRGSGMGNDLSGFTARFGLLGMLTFLGLTVAGFQKLTGGSPWVSLAAAGAVLIILNGEAFLEHPAFLSLMFLATASTGPDARRRRHAIPPWRWEMVRAASGMSPNLARRIMRCQVPR